MKGNLNGTLAFKWNDRWMNLYYPVGTLLHLQRDELPYPKDSRDTRGPEPGASSYQDFVDVFCQAMWNCPNKISVINRRVRARAWAQRQVVWGRLYTCGAA